MTPVETLLALRQKEGRACVQDGRLVVIAPEPLSPEVLDALKEHKAELVRMLGPTRAPKRRVVCLRCGGPLKDTVEEAWQVDGACRWAWQRGEP